jgi:hypothetical protein
MPNGKAIRKLPSQKYLRECFTYNRRTGVLRWRRRPRRHFATTNSWAVWNRKHARTIAGCLVPAGYRYVGLNHTIYKAHRVIWKIVTSREPPATIDHVKGNVADNRWHRLRAATMLEQNWNARLKRNNTSGHCGVYRVGSGRYGAHIRINRAYRYLGTFDTKEEAAAVRNKAARALHRSFYRER